MYSSSSSILNIHFALINRKNTSIRTNKVMIQSISLPLLSAYFSTRAISNNAKSSTSSTRHSHHRDNQKERHSVYQTNEPKKNQQNFLSISSTANAASDSFIRDSNSPLFKSTKSDQIKGNFVKLNENNKKIKKESKRLQNICQNDESMMPSKKMNKIATKDELQLVLKHFEYAKHKNIEQILTENEYHVIKKRDKIYSDAQKQGITASSNDILRLKVLADVVEYTFMNIEPPNEYTKRTDRKHFKEVGAMAAKFAKDNGMTPSISLLFSAWCHDIERFIPSIKCEYLPERVDKYRKQIIHGISSAKVALCLLDGAPVTDKEKSDIYEMILHHDIPNPREDIVILGKTLIYGASDALMKELEILMDADSFAFFQSTIPLFILYKSKKNSPDWIWERVRNNILRLRVHLRPKACKLLYKLPQHLHDKMAIDYEEMKSVLFG